MRKSVVLTRMGSGLGALTIIILSLIPGKMRPHIFGSDLSEHFVAYLFVGGLLAIGYPRPMQLLSRGILLTICAGSLEFVQLWIPGRTASAGGFATSTVGAWIGLLLIVVVRRAHERRIVAPCK